MFQSILDNHAEPKEIFFRKQEVQYLLSDREIFYLQDIVSVLKIFDDATKFLSGQKYPTIHTIINYHDMLEDYCRSETDDSPLKKTFKQRLLQGIHSKWSRRISM